MLLRTLLFTLFCLPWLHIPPALGQVLPDRIEVNGHYLMAGSMRDAVSKSSGPGTSAVIHFRAPGALGIAVAAGLHRLDIDQREAIERWDWGYWELQWENETDILLRSPDYEARQVPVQSAVLISGALMPTLNLDHGRITAQLAVGPSVTYFARRLYLDEQWQRYYPDADHTFEIAFRNYAEDRTGAEIGGDARVSAAYRVSSLFDLTAGIYYRRLFRESAQLPLNDFIGAQLGLAFTY